MAKSILQVSQNGPGNLASLPPIMQQRVILVTSEPQKSASCCGEFPNGRAQPEFRLYPRTIRLSSITDPIIT